MKIAVVSDTHRSSKYIKEVKRRIQDCDVLLHLGDNVDDAEELAKDFKGNVYVVAGNCDFTRKYPKEQIIELAGKTIYVTHGDLYGVKYGMGNIFYKGKEVNADIVLFGHTHEQIVFEEEGITFMNPGSPSLPRGSRRGMGYIQLEEGNVPDIYTVEIV